jgi:hypothetical protein
MHEVSVPFLIVQIIKTGHPKREFLSERAQQLPDIEYEWIFDPCPLEMRVAYGSNVDNELKKTYLFEYLIRTTQHAIDDLLHDASLNMYLY